MKHGEFELLFEFAVFVVKGAQDPRPEILRCAQDDRMT